jgi:hypothetical protein
MTPQSHLGSTEGNMDHELMIRDYIFKGNTPKAVKFDVDDFVCSIVGGMGRRRAAIIKKDQFCE